MKALILTITTTCFAASWAMGAVIYNEDFTDQDGKGKVGTAAVDTSGVDWTVDVSNGDFTASDDFFSVNNGIFEAQDVDAQISSLVSWSSPTFSITGLTDLSFSFDAFANGDFEAADDRYLVEFLIDGNPETLFDATVDETVAGDPMFFGSTQLTDTLANFSSDITGTGSNGQVRISIGNNAGTELQGFDNLQVSAIPETSTTLPLAALCAAGLVARRRK
jgi:hypothetical protein